MSGLGWVANMVQNYSYITANKNSQTAMTGLGAVLQEQGQKLLPGLSDLFKVFICIYLSFF